MQYCKVFKWICAFIVFFSVQQLLAQTDSSGNKSEPTTIKILNATQLIAQTLPKGEQVQKLIGRVVLAHEGAIMFCDSAILHPQSNFLTAYSRIHIEQGDTLDMYGDTLKYNANTKIAKIIGNVRLIDPNIKLRTDRLTYNRTTGIAQYNDSATIYTKEDVLTSEQGYYYANTQQLAFRTDVVLKNPEYTLYSDTMIYHTTTDVSYFYGPTEIISDSSYIYCENGWYDKANDRCQFNENAYVQSQSRTLSGDSLYYERKSGYGQAINNIKIVDTAENVIITGNFAETFKDIEKYIVTDSAQMIRVFDADSMFLHADTLVAYEDTAGYRILKAYYKVKMYKSNLQASCDSLSYSKKDSLLRMYHKPVIWNDSTQLTAKFITLKMAEGELYEMYLKLNSIMIEQEDTVKYNQIAGINMIGYFQDNELRKIDVFGDGRVYYYAQEDNGDMIGLNETECVDLTIYMQDKSIEKIIFYQNPVGTMHPLNQINPKDYRMENFSWQIKRRPASPKDIFVWP